MPGAAVAGIGLIGSTISAGAATAVASGRKKYAQYIAPDEANYDPNGMDRANQFYQMGIGATNKDIDPYAKEQQKALLSELQGAAAGQGAVQAGAKAQAQAGRDAAIKTAMAMAGSARGPNIGGAQIGATQAATSATQNSANAAAQNMANIQLGALSQQGGVLGGMRAADLQETQRLDQLREFYLKMGASREEAALRAKQQFEEEKGRRQAEFQHLAAQEEAGKVGETTKALAGMGQGFSSFGAQGKNMGGGGGGPKAGA